MAGEGRLIGEELRGAVAVISLARPPVNGLDRPLLQALSAALRRAEAATEVQAIVLAGEGAQFCGGLDPRELGQTGDVALVPVVDLIDRLSKPVVAVLHGNVLGGGLELALACHGRVADEGARLGLPEIALGLLPVAGGTQRLARLVGAPVALQMLMEGKALSAVEALAMGLVDAVVEGGVEGAVKAQTQPGQSASRPSEQALARGLSLAEALMQRPISRSLERREGLRDPLAYNSAVAEARRRLGPTALPALRAAVDCVEAALLLPAEQGLAFEAAQSETVAESPEAAGLRHAYAVERRALSQPANLGTGPEISRLTILGTKGMVPDVALQALAAGLAVRLVGAEREALADALQQIAARQEAMVAEGRLSAAAREADWARLAAVMPGEADAPADLVLVSPDAPRLARLPGPAVALGGKGPVVLYPAVGSGALAQLALTPVARAAALADRVPQAAAQSLARRLGWRLILQGPGGALDQRLRQALSRAVSALETQGQTREVIRAGIAVQGLLGQRPEMGAAASHGAEVEAVGTFCLLALIVEAMRLLEEGIAMAPFQVDAAAVLARVMPRVKGGPLFQADQIGLMALRADLRDRAAALPQLFSAPDLLDRLIGDGKTLGDLNRR